MLTPREVVDRIAAHDVTPEERVRTAAIRALLEATECAHKEYDDEDALSAHVLLLYRVVIAFGTDLPEGTDIFVRG